MQTLQPLILTLSPGLKTKEIVVQPREFHPKHLKHRHRCDTARQSEKSAVIPVIWQNYHHDINACSHLSSPVWGLRQRLVDRQVFHQTTFQQMLWRWQNRYLRQSPKWHSRGCNIHHKIRAHRLKWHFANPLNHQSPSSYKGETSETKLFL